MHEAGVADRMLELVLDRARGTPGPVTVVEVEAGESCGVSVEALRFHWAEASHGTRAEGAELRILAVDDASALRLAAIEVADD